MDDELKARIQQRAHEKWESEGRPQGLAGRHWLDAEHELREEAENAAMSRWAAPVSGTYVETSNEAARIANQTRNVAAARK